MNDNTAFGFVGYPIKQMFAKPAGLLYLKWEKT